MPDNRRSLYADADDLYFPPLMRRILIHFAFLLVCLPAVAQISAHELAKRVDDHYNSLQSLKAGFTETYDGMGQHREESGTLLLRKPGRMTWDYSSTPGKIFVLDGKFAWFYAPGDSQVQRIPAKQLDDLRSPLRFLLGHTKLESELQNLTMTPVSGGGFTLSGLPKGQEKRIAKIALVVNVDGTIRSMEIDELPGARTAFEFSNQQPNAVIPDSVFHFTPPKGVPVVNALPPV